MLAYSQLPVESKSWLRSNNRQILCVVYLVCRRISGRGIHGNKYLGGDNVARAFIQLSSLVSHACFWALNRGRDLVSSKGDTLPCSGEAIPEIANICQCVILVSIASTIGSILAFQL
jgi:hypothetical protein